MDFIRITSARHLGGHRLALSFSDRSEGRVDLSEELSGPVNEPLRDIDYFKQFQCVGSTLEWSNGADFAPEFLYQLAQSQEAAIH
jgi:hypothetical protein